MKIQVDTTRYVYIQGNDDPTVAVKIDTDGTARFDFNPTDSARQGVEFRSMWMGREEVENLRRLCSRVLRLMP